MTDPTEIARVAAGLTRAQREAVEACHRRVIGASGEKWDFALLKAGTRKSLVSRGIASPWGVVSASLTPLGLLVRDHILREKSGG